MVVADYLALFAVICIWGLLLINIVLIVAGYVYYLKNEARKVPEIPVEVPFVSVMVPAHNEGKVIVKTVESLLAFDYPVDRYEIIVINDNSSDNSAELLAAIQAKNPTRFLKIINTDNITGGKGKSNALNI
ncbi:glycosyltransferase, partial [Listeria monocytogenes serotype 1/2a]|nr:glycosyltransferase [Listeria monocytogenes serotype 1/2a]